MDIFHTGPRQHQVPFASCFAANCQQKGEILFENRRGVLPRPSAVCIHMVLNNTFPSVYTPLGKNGKGTSPTRYRSTSDCCTHEKKSACTRHDRTACSFFCACSRYQRVNSHTFHAQYFTSGQVKNKENIWEISHKKTPFLITKHEHTTMRTRHSRERVHNNILRVEFTTPFSTFFLCKYSRGQVWPLKKPLSVWTDSFVLGEVPQRLFH